MYSTYLWLLEISELKLSLRNLVIECIDNLRKIEIKAFHGNNILNNGKYSKFAAFQTGNSSTKYCK